MISKQPLTTAQKVTGGVSVAVLAAAVAAAPYFTAPREGFSDTAYKDIAGVWTDCYGNTGPDVVPGVKRTKEYCLEKLTQETGKVAAVVVAAVKVPVTVERMVALMDFVYNVGSNAFNNSTLLRKLNAGDTFGACDQFLRWTMIKSPLGGYDDMLDGTRDGYKNCALNGLRAPCAGIAKRRQDERNMCLIGTERPNA